MVHPLAWPARPILLVAHPGHELRLFHWMERRRPIVLILTDGSGAAARSRLQYSRRAIQGAGASAGPLFGLAPDQAWYEALLHTDPALFERAVDAVCEAMLMQASDLLVTDAVDGYNPIHDLCEAIGAVARQRLAGAGFDVRHLASRAIAGPSPSAIVEAIALPGDAQRRKRCAIEAYAPLAHEAARLLLDEPGAIATERLRLADFSWPSEWTPHWEEIGRARVAASRYRQEIGYKAHVLPMARALGLRATAPETAEPMACAS